MIIHNIVKKAGTKAADKIATLAALSPEQLEEVEKRKEEYLNKNPNPDDETAQAITENLISAASIEIYNAYLPQIKQLYLPVDTITEYGGKVFNSSYNIRFCRITKWVTDQTENNLEKLVNVYASLSNENCNIALIFHRTRKETEVYLGIANIENADNNVNADNFQKRITDSLRGNFPGSEWTETKAGIIPFLKDDSLNYSVACASNIPTEKSEKFISQTIEKLLDGIVPDEKKNEYTLILLATPVNDVEIRKLRLAELYTALAPYSGWQTNFNYNEGSSTTSSATFGLNAGVSAGVQHGQNNSITNNQSRTDSENQSVTDSESESKTDSSSNTENDTSTKTETHTDGRTEQKGTVHTEGTGVSESNSHGNSFNVGVETGVSGKILRAGVNTNVGVNNSTSYSESTNVSDAINQSVSHNAADTVGETFGKVVGKTVGHAVASQTGKAVTNALGKAVTRGVAITSGATKAVNFGGNFGANFARSSNVTLSVGRNEGVIQSFENFTIKHTLEILKEQMKRYEQSVALGMWDFAAYVLSEDNNTVNNVAHTYLALTQGEKSFLSQAAVNVWRGDVAREKEAANEIYYYLRQFRHPLFVLNPNIAEENPEFFQYPAVITAATSLSGKELAYSLNFPQKAIPGLPVLKCAEFGRNVVSYGTSDTGETISLGRVFHMNKVENVPVNLSLQSLTGHAFITGSTGSGKSNTIYQILNETRKKGIKFLVIEPAKGEYKTILGGYDDVRVLGTNPKITELLRINPFSFPEEIHVLEHIDRLIELFNVCWPMYAAMPAVLKNAVEKSYEDCGWNLVTSENEFGKEFYPAFQDVTENVKRIIDTSEYDSENKGAYKGSLLTRLQSLSNGINGLVFTGDEITSEELFDENVIVDLSRVGSSETKSLLMGMMVLKLQEYRMSKTEAFNEELKHITVLEEAHNLLKRTSTAQSAESANLLGKSVEMLSNSIAEMRTYGEGFIIADQAPALLDMSVIRNTNTKVIMRLPDESDRILVGKAANIDDSQIVELAKLPRGVGAVYQNEWVQPVLCQINRFPKEPLRYHYDPETLGMKKDEFLNERVRIAELLSKGTGMSREAVLTGIKPLLCRMGIPASEAVAVMKMLLNPPKEPRITKLAPIMTALFPDITESVRSSCDSSSVEKEWTAAAVDVLQKGYQSLDEQVRRDIVQSIITYVLLIQKNDIEKLRDWSIRGGL